MPPHSAAALRQKAHVKFGVMGRQGPVPHPVQEVIQRRLLARGVRHHGIGDAGQLHNVAGDGTSRIDKGVVLIDHHTLLQYHSTDFGNPLPPAVQSGGLDVKADDFRVQRQVTVAVDHHAVIHIIDIISFHAVDHFDLIACRAGRVREGLGNAVVGDGNGGMPPGDGPLHRVLHLRQGVHLRKARM